MGRAIKRSVARLLITALLFMQFAVAAYACPNLGPLAESGAAPAAMVPEPVGDDMAHCMTPDPADPNRCLQHCQQGSQTADSGAPVAFPAALLPLLAVLPVDCSLAAAGPPGQSELLARSTAPPPSIRFCVLRN